MNKVVLKKQYVKTKRLLITFFVLVRLFISENVYSRNHWSSDYVKIIWNAKRQYIGIGIGVYDYSFGPNFEHGFLESCKLEYSVNNVNYNRLLEITTEKQNYARSTTVYLKNKLDKADIRFRNNLLTPVGAMWPDDNSSSNIKVLVCSRDMVAVVGLEWHLERDHRQVYFIRISGKWHVDGSWGDDLFNNIIYQVNVSVSSVLKLKTPVIKTKLSENDTVKVFKELEDIIIKGAEIGSNIKVYTTIGTEVHTVISNNDVVKIKLPAKQFYIVHIGKFRYKVAL